MPRWLSAALSAVLVVPWLAWGAEPVELPPGQTDPLPMREYHLGTYQKRSPRNGWTDPVPALGENDDPAAFSGPNARLPKGFLEAYLGRIEAWHAEHSAPPAGLIPWLKAHPEVRKEIWAAIDPRFDEAHNALAILDALRLKNERKLSEYRHLAVALAIVHDAPEAPISSRLCFLWGVRPSQFGQTLTWPEIWDYFTDLRRQEGMVFRPKELAWPLMTHLVDLDVSREEIDWAWTSHAKTSHEVGPLYAQVPYDQAKLAQHGTALGDRPYILANLVQYGGVCVDQAHYASRMAKIFGVPALKCAGEGRYGGIGHAWTGFLAVDRRTGAPVLDFTGRYQFDFFYTGTAFDPHTQVEILDRTVELMYDGVSGKYDTYRDASVLTRAALALEGSQPAAALVIAREAVQVNPFVGDAWRLLLRLAGTGVLPLKDADRLYHQQLRQLYRHPDLGLECLRLYQAALAKGKIETRQFLYAEAYQTFGTAKRPDLQIQVRLDQLADLAAAKRSREVITLAFETVAANAKEGTLIMPLVKQIVELSQVFVKTEPTFNLKAVKDGLAKFSADFPKVRGDMISPAWEEYQQLMRSLP